MFAYVGRRCVATLSRDPLVVQIGILRSLDEEGEAVIDDDDGVRHWCWPVLEISPAAELEIGDYFSRCSYCRGNASPDEERHVHGGRGSGYQKGSSLDDTNGCGAVFTSKTYIYARGLNGSTG